MSECKTCTKCKQRKTIAEFYKSKNGKLGVGSLCKMCHAIFTKAWRDANPERVNATKKAWREANPERAKASSKKWRETNRTG